MRSRSSRFIGRALPALALLAISAACDEGSSLVDPPAAERGEAVQIQALECTADVRTGSVACGGDAGEPAEGISRIVLNPTGRWVRLTNGASSYADGILAYDATVQNLIPQTLGVDRNGQPDGAGVRVFFAEPPTVTEGTGTVTVNGAETSKFTAQGQLFYRYPQTLAPNETSAPRQWSFTVPETVVSFQFKVLVAASVQHPRGWLEIAGGSILRVPRGATRALKAVVRDSLGRDVTASAGPVTWSVDDASVATIAGSTLTGAAVSGTSAVTAASGTLSASARIEVGSPFTQLAAGEYHTCGLASTGRVYCWGRNDSGQLGDNSFISRNTPAGVATSQLFVQVTTGTYHTCALTAAGQAYCWGSNWGGALGDNTTTMRDSPVPVQQGGTAFARITAGHGSTCGQTAAGQSWCWGFNGFGQLGDGTVVNRHVPVQVNQRGIAYGDITGGWTHYCARSSPRLVFCWGANDGGQVGDSTFQHRSAPAQVRQGTERFVQMSGGHILTCALSGTGQAYCWGWNSNGQLGDNTDVSKRTPVAVQQGATKFVQVSAGGFYACGLTAAGQAWCWGHGTSGQLGDNAGTDRFAPVAVQQAGSAYVEITTGFRQTCGRTAAGRVYCWGDNTFGQLGNATTFGAVAAPVAVERAP